MPRDANGDYTKPLPDVVAGDVIQSSWANTTISDLEQAMTDSLDRNGRGGMLAPFAFADGVVSAPGATFSNETTSGLWRAGPGDIRMAVLGTDITRWNAGNLQVWNGTSWDTVLVSSATSVPIAPGVTGTATLHWDGSAWIENPDFLVSTDGDVTSTGGLWNGIDVVQRSADLAALDVTVNDHVNTTEIHFADAPIDGNSYVRKDGVWELEATNTGFVTEARQIASGTGLTGGGDLSADRTLSFDQTYGDARYLQVGGTAANSTQWANYNLVVGPAAGDPNTIYMVV